MVKKPKFVHINIKVLSFCVALVVCILLFNTILFAYKYYQSKSSCDEQPDLLEWTHSLREENSMSTVFDGRLPTSMRPVEYKIKILPFITEDNFTFAGEVWVKLDVKSSTNNVTIHIHELDILDYSIKVMGIDEKLGMSKGRQLQVGQVISEARNQFVVFILDNEQFVSSTKYELYIKYSGRLNNNMRGLYRSSYTTQNVTR